jgi:ankyrin repeat protein
MELCGCCKMHSVQGEIFKRCGGCKDEFYCNEDCQRTAWKTGHKKACKERVHQKSFVKIQQDPGQLLIFYVNNQNEVEVEGLLNDGVDPNYVWTQNLNNTALRSACYLGNEKIVKLLLKFGSRIHCEDLSENALHWACLAGRHRCVSVLLDHDISLLDEATEDGGMTPVYFASTFGHMQCLSVLIQYGADVVKPDHTPSTPAIAAIWYNRIQTLSLLLQQESVDINCVDGNNLTMLQVARQYGRSKIVTLLLEKGAVDSGVAAPELTEAQRMDATKQYAKELRRDAKRCEYPECNDRSQVFAPEELKKCSGCMVVCYCCEAHQKLHWKEHKSDCKKFMCLL